MIKIHSIARFSHPCCYDLGSNAVELATALRRCRRKKNAGIASASKTLRTSLGAYLGSWFKGCLLGPLIWDALEPRECLHCNPCTSVVHWEFPEGWCSAPNGAQRWHILCIPPKATEVATDEPQRETRHRRAPACAAAAQDGSRDRHRMDGQQDRCHQPVKTAFQHRDIHLSQVRTSRSRNSLEASITQRPRTHRSISVTDHGPPLPDSAQKNGRLGARFPDFRLVQS